MSLLVHARLPQYVLISKNNNLNKFISIKEILRKLYHYNHRTENWDLNTSSSTQSESIHIWGGPLTRHALQAIYTLAFICLLRSDEVLKICRDHIEFVKEDNDIQYMILTLPFRKTHQDGRTFNSLEFFPT